MVSPTHLGSTKKSSASCDSTRLAKSLGRSKRSYWDLNGFIWLYILWFEMYIYIWFDDVYIYIYIYIRINIHIYIYMNI